MTNNNIASFCSLNAAQNMVGLNTDLSTFKTELENLSLLEELPYEGEASMPKNYQKRGNPFLRGKTWTFYYRETNLLTGKKGPPIYRGGYATKKEAEAALKTIESQIVLGQYATPTKENVATYLLRWLEENWTSRRPNTLRGYSVNIKNHNIPRLGAIPLRLLNRAHIKHMHNAMLAEGYAPNTIRYAHRTLSVALNDALLDKS